ncbi:hypothetical protein PC113_g14172 [Phytophthora cactorum]|uniref:Uncharacterized protein n=2 Tax=Phytophthora cactorum TaxID=29920 RepID=A0A8T0YVA8_9STRA|nr:hypothetical protein PC113_g14172 [Phytophthora cactorum]KAG3076223.1 hypothetical protein PC122_g13654 [Phytophthora cactorum]KAG3190256.1 hypothetical protein PC128_g11414 [Phytophthora cactorum]
MKFSAIITLLPLSLLTMSRAKMHLYFNNRFMGFGFDHTQRCYTISHCWDDHSKNSEWSGLPNPGEMVWFEDKYCAGDSIAKDATKGSIDFKGSKLYNKVSSFMVRQYGLYATDGIVDYCHENSTLNTNTTASGYFFIELDAAGAMAA